LRARPEPTQLEHLSDASFLGKLLVFPSNVRLDRKVITRYKKKLNKLFKEIVSNLALFCLATVLATFSKKWAIFSKSSGHSAAQAETHLKFLEFKTFNFLCCSFHTLELQCLT
jgi:hypothetical protein